MTVPFTREAFTVASGRLGELRHLAVGPALPEGNRFTLGIDVSFDRQLLPGKSGLIALGDGGRFEFRMIANRLVRPGREVSAEVAEHFPCCRGHPVDQVQRLMGALFVPGRW